MQDFINQIEESMNRTSILVIASFALAFIILAIVSMLININDFLNTSMSTRLFFGNIILTMVSGMWWAFEEPGNRIRIPIGIIFFTSWALTLITVFYIGKIPSLSAVLYG